MSQQQALPAKKVVGPGATDGHQGAHQSQRKPPARASTAAHGSMCGLPECPLLRPEVQSAYQDVRRQSGAFSRQLGDFLQRLVPDERAAWLRTSLAASRELFQPWTLEVLYGISAMSPARFSMLEQTLEVPAKTLSQRLKTLVSMGLVERHVHAEVPVRIEYTLTKDGRATAALASPLFTHLNMVARNRMQESQT